MKEKNWLKPTLLVLCTLLVGGVAGYFISYYQNKPSAEEQKLIDEYNLLQDEWLYEEEDTEFGELAAKGLASTIASSANDPFTFYTSNSSDQGLATEGKGFGIKTHPYDGNLYVTEVHTESIAHQKGIQVGDVLTSLTSDGETYTFKDHSPSEINNRIAPVKNTVTLKGKRGEQELSWTMAPSEYSEDLISLLSTPSASNGYTLGIRVNTFLGSSSLAVESIVKNYKGTAKKLVLDLRGNGGGYVSQASKMASLFVKKGTLLYRLVDKNGKTIEEETQKNNPEYTYDSLSLIIDGGSASASEIFTLALRAGSNAVVYGDKSYGKGIAQNFKTFSDGSVLRYTSAYVYGPERENETMYDEGKDSDKVMCIHGKGILPDVPFSFHYYDYQLVADFTQSIGISENAQIFFLEILNGLDSSYPDSYSKDYHYIDAVKDYANSLSARYNDTSYGEAFNEKGAMLKIVNDKFTKEEYDKYLEEYDRLTNEVFMA